METLILSLVSLFFILHTAATSTTTSSPTDFIVASCEATRYPVLCVECLSGYASTIQQSQHQLAQTALLVSLARVRSAASFVRMLTNVRGINVSEYRAVKDCIEMMGDGVDRLAQSARELGYLGRAGGGRHFMWHMSNVQTWVSSALTDENTCLDGFADRRMDGNVKGAVRRWVVTVAEITSNALALVNLLAEKHLEPKT